MTYPSAAVDPVLPAPAGRRTLPRRRALVLFALGLVVGSGLGAGGAAVVAVVREGNATVSPVGVRDVRAAAVREGVEHQVLARLAAVSRSSLPPGFLDPATGLPRNNTTIACLPAGREVYACEVRAGDRGPVRLVARTDRDGNVTRETVGR